MPRARSAAAPGMQRIEPHSPGLRSRVWWGAGNRDSAEWAGRVGVNLMSSTLLTEDRGLPFDVLQAEQIDAFRAAWRDAGHAGEPRVSVSRSIFPLTTAEDHLYFGGQERGRGRRLHRRLPLDVRKDLRGRAGCARGAARRGCGDRERRHADAHDPEPAGRRSSTSAWSSPSRSTSRLRWAGRARGRDRPLGAQPCPWFAASADRAVLPRT